MGAHTLHLYGRRLHVLVMENLFSADETATMRKYDIKGSWVNRSAGVPAEGKTVFCKNCNQGYVYRRASARSKTRVLRRNSALLDPARPSHGGRESDDERARTARAAASPNFFSVRRGPGRAPLAA